MESRVLPDIEITPGMDLPIKAGSADVYFHSFSQRCLHLELVARWARFERGLVFVIGSVRFMKKVVAAVLCP
jgi:hypothetical protein